MNEIPTMECRACGGRGSAVATPQMDGTVRPCHRCDGTGRVPRPPLSLDEIAALPEGARVVVRGGREITIDSAGARLCVLLDFYAAGVWLADEGE